MIIPALFEFEEYLDRIQKVIIKEVDEYTAQELKRLNLPAGSSIPDACSKGSTRIFINKRTKLGKFLMSIPYDPHKNYFVSEGSNCFHLTLRKITSINYMQNQFANELLAQYIKTDFGWVIYCDVDMD